MIVIPNRDRNMGIARKTMPQIRAPHRQAFFDFLRREKSIDVVKDVVHPGDLIPTQKNFNTAKIKEFADDVRSGRGRNFSEKPSTLVSQDNYIVDGHHRTIGSYNAGTTKYPVYRVQANIHHVIGYAKEFLKTLKEEGISQKDFQPTLQNFVTYAKDYLGIKSHPTVRMIASDDSLSFGGFSPHDKSISIKTKNRHPMDILRTTGHELVHYKQDEDGRITDPVKEGETGSEIENEANAIAGILMRNYGKKNPSAFEMSHLTEAMSARKKPSVPRYKAVIMAGGPGSGKDYVAKQTLYGHGLREINSDHAFEMLLGKRGLDKKMPESQAIERDAARNKAKSITKIRERHHIDSRHGIIINTTGHDPKKIGGMKSRLESLGYDTKMVFVHSHDEVSKKRNIERGNAGGRSVPEKTRKLYWQRAQDAIPQYKEMFGDNFHHVDNSLDFNTATDEQKSEQAAQFHKVFKHVRKFVTSPTKNPLSSEKPVPKKKLQIKNSANDPQKLTQKLSRATKAQSSVTKRVKKVPVSKTHMDIARSLGLSYFGYGRFGRKSSGKPVVTHVVQNGKLVKKTTMNEDFMVEFANTPSAREWGKPSLTKIYTDDTPGQGKKKKRVMRDRIAQEGNSPSGILDSPSGKSTLPQGGGVGPEYGISNGPAFFSMSFPYGVYGMGESVLEWAQRPETQKRFIKKYGDAAEKKLNETVERMIMTFDTAKRIDTHPKIFSKIREAWENELPGSAGSVPSTSTYKDDDPTLGGEVQTKKTINKRPISKRGSNNV